jgi:hypothetical protein
MHMRAVNAQRGFSVLAVIVCLLFSMIVGVIGVLSIYASLGDEIYAEDPVQWRIDHEEADRGAIPPVSNKFVWMVLTFTSLLSIASGYIAGRIGREAPIFHAVVAGIIVIVLGILMGRGGHDPTPAWANALGFLTTLPLMILGAWMASQD